MCPKVRIACLPRATLGSYSEWDVINSMIQASKTSQWIKVPIHKPDGLHAISRTHVKRQFWNPSMTLEVETGWWTISLPASKAGVHSTEAKAKATPHLQGGRCEFTPESVTLTFTSELWYPCVHTKNKQKKIEEKNPQRSNRKYRFLC